MKGVNKVALTIYLDEPKTRRNLDLQQRGQLTLVCCTVVICVQCFVIVPPFWRVQMDDRIKLCVNVASRHLQTPQQKVNPTLAAADLGVSGTVNMVSWSTCKAKYLDSLPKVPRWVSPHMMC